MRKKFDHVNICKDLLISFNNDKKEETSSKYSLYAICFHSGEFDSGHYSSKLCSSKPFF